jgi:hypothetical protein
MACFLAYAIGLSAAPQQELPTRAAQLFGQPMNAEHRVYRLNGSYVIWLVCDVREELIEVVVGPESYYASEFPHAPLTTKRDFLSKTDYEVALQQISQLKDIGALRKEHEKAVSSQFGRLSTDQFERAFVDRIVADDDEELVKKFDVYFLRESSGSPEQLETVQGQSMVCLVGEWYYIKPETKSRITLGAWQDFQVAGPNQHGMEGCARTTVLHDSDGFTIEEPQNGTIRITTPFRARVLEGRVAVGGEPVPDANVEVRSVGGTGILRTKTNEEGNFRILGAQDGEYKFKVTKDGFKSLSGEIIVDQLAPPKTLEFEIEVGT